MIALLATAEHLPSMMIKSLQRFETAVQCQMDIAQVEKDLAKERKKKGHAAAAKVRFFLCAPHAAHAARALIAAAPHSPASWRQNFAP